MTIHLWQAFLVFCVGSVAGWIAHTGYLALKKEDETDQEWLDRHEKAENSVRETAKKIMEGRI